ncbi:MAG TPA: flagellar FliJ family protein [Spirochaetota bacterium]|nr:flagellar FliJ family protein [Spirochaetota bacterium]
MKKYNFKLERLLKIKEYKERLAEEEYSKELQKKIILERENKKMSRFIENSVEEEFFEAKVGEKIDIESFYQHERYIRSLELKTLENNQKKEELEPVIQKLKDKLIDATKEKKIMDKLKEKDFEKYKDERNKQDTIKMDEIASIMQINKTK